MDRLGVFDSYHLVALTPLTFLLRFPVRRLWTFKNDDDDRDEDGNEDKMDAFHAKYARGVIRHWGMVWPHCARRKRE